MTPPSRSERFNRAPLQADDIKGSLHMHTTDSDGEDTLEAMVEGARERGYRYIAVTDHGDHLMRPVSGGTTRLDEQADRIAALREQQSDVHILHGAEVDVARDGTLDFPERALARLDLCIASVHSEYELPSDEQTARIVSALSHPRVHILGHPLGQYQGKRPPMQIDFDRIAHAAAQHGVALEINGKPERMDLPAPLVRRSMRAGARLVLSADAHSVRDHDQLLNAVRIAQESELTTEAIINTKSVEGITGWLEGQPLPTL